MQGDILQVVTHPTEPTATFQSICCFGHKLLVSYTYFIVESTATTMGYLSYTRTQKQGMLALQGL